MSSLRYHRYLTFSGHHGRNIVIRDNTSLAEGQYIKAHGQFITHRPLTRNDSFTLEFRGTGIVKFNTFPYKKLASDWVLSCQPLPRGCKRIKMRGCVRYNVRVPNSQEHVLIESMQNPEREVFTLSMGPETILAFDIEYGDIVVNIRNMKWNITFDTYFHSPCIEIMTSQRISSASLIHYNPSALCCLEDTPLEPGAIFVLEVKHSGVNKDSGSYIRICVAKQHSPYENDKVIPCVGSSLWPLYIGKRVTVAVGSTLTLRIRVTLEGLVIDRKKTAEVDILVCSTMSENTLWFELHKVSLRVWRILDCTAHQVKRLSPPPPLPPKPSVCHHYPVCSSKYAQGRHMSSSELRRVCAGGHLGESSLSNVGGKNVSVVHKDYNSYVSADNWCLVKDVNCSTFPLRAPRRSMLSCTGTLQRDLLCDVFVDSSPLMSAGPDLITMSSTESLNKNRDSEHNHSLKASLDANSSHYQRPHSIWTRVKPHFSELASPCLTLNNSPKQETENSTTTDIK